jgi:hypothetical protein
MEVEADRGRLRAALRLGDELLPDISSCSASARWSTPASCREHGGAIVAVAAGRYEEDALMLDRPVRLWGRCPGRLDGPVCAWSMPCAIRYAHHY